LVGDSKALPDAELLLEDALQIGAVKGDHAITHEVGARHHARLECRAGCRVGLAWTAWARLIAQAVDTIRI
jgi:hypothetical protein